DFNSVDCHGSFPLFVLRFRSPPGPGKEQRKCHGLIKTGGNETTPEGNERADRGNELERKIALPGATFNELNQCLFFWIRAEFLSSRSPHPRWRRRKPSSGWRGSREGGRRPSGRPNAPPWKTFRSPRRGRR